MYKSNQDILAMPKRDLDYYYNTTLLPVYNAFIKWVLAVAHKERPSKTLYKEFKILVKQHNYKDFWRCFMFSTNALLTCELQTLRECGSDADTEKAIRQLTVFLEGGKFVRKIIRDAKR